MHSQSNKNIYPFWMLLPALAVYTVFTIVPVVISIALSFTDWNIERLYAPEWKGVSNFITLFQDDIFLRSIGNTLIFALFTTVLKTLGGLLLALALYKAFAGSGVLRAVFYAPCALSVTVVGVLFKSILANDGLLNYALSMVNLGGLATNWLAEYGTALGSTIVVESWMWAGFNMFIFISALQAVPKDLYEYAEIEGASKTVTFFKITLPLIAPAMTTVVTLSVSGGLKVFDIIYVLTNGGPGFDTQVLSTYTYQSFSLGLLGESSAATVILSLIVVTISFILNRYLVAKEVSL